MYLAVDFNPSGDKDRQIFTLFTHESVDVL